MIGFKFRIWDKVSKIMYDKALVGNYPQTLPLIYTSYNGKKDWYHIEPKLCEVMQYTGMDDTLFNEIYLGDIVELSKGDIIVKGQIVFELGAFAIAINEDDMNKIFEDNWNDNIKFLGELYWEQDYLYENIIECLKVIGNIYENPDLID